MRSTGQGLHYFTLISPSLGVSAPPTTNIPEQRHRERVRYGPTTLISSKIGTAVQREYRDYNRKKTATGKGFRRVGGDYESDNTGSAGECCLRVKRFKEIDEAKDEKRRGTANGDLAC